jgi:hypothetical protein
MADWEQFQEKVLMFDKLQVKNDEKLVDRASVGFSFPCTSLTESKTVPESGKLF